MNTQEERLRQARIDAGYPQVSDAVRHFEWNYSTYAGHENGHRGIKFADVQKYAAAFGVTAEWLTTGRDARQITAAHADDNPHNIGMAESAVAPFQPKSDTLRRKIIAMAEAMAPSTQNPTFFVLTQHQPSVMLMIGDILVVDQKRLSGKNGGLIVSQIANTETGSGKTVLRIARDGILTPPFGEPDLDADEEEASVGSVICSIRPA